MLEASVESYLKRRVEQLGGICLKADQIFGRSFVDRICFLPGGRTLIVELKRPKGGHRRPRQVEIVKMLQSIGHEAVFCKTKEEVDAVLG